MTDVKSERRIVRVEIIPEILASTLKTGEKTSVHCIECVPPDAKFVGASIDPRSMRIFMFFTHNDFAVVHEGFEIPAQMCIFENG